MSNKRKSNRPKLLSNTRPACLKKPSSLSSCATRSLIRTHHTLRKELHSARQRNDPRAAASLEAQIETQGGLAKYQHASIQGQSLQRGGDSSQILMRWLSELTPEHGVPTKHSQKYKMLEVGALKTDNACSRSAILDVTRIDLHSQYQGIHKQDFMERPIPSPSTLEVEGFDVVSLSLVVNYVADAVGRGNMLKRVSCFLRKQSGASEKNGVTFPPALFLVLPASCVTNSRYLDEDRLVGIMRSLGYKEAKRKMSPKLVYYLWTYEEGLAETEKKFRKEAIISGKSRNNFAIVIA